MATLSFLWHLHQPSYRTADGTAHAPWVAIHAGGAYTTLVRSLLETGAPGQVVNLSPTLVEQLEAYAQGTVSDPLLAVLACPAEDLDGAARDRLLEWGCYVTARQLARHPRLAELRGQAAGWSPSSAELRDLQVSFILAQAGDQAWRDPELADLTAGGRDFTAQDHSQAATWLAAQPARLLGLLDELATGGTVELSTNPYAHPILPLLIDTGVVARSASAGMAPGEPLFRHPEDARRQLTDGLRFARDRGVEPAGCWPPEGALSEATVRLYSEAGIRWLVADEGLLERSLGRALRRDSHAAPELGRPWQLAGSSPALLFRDRELSDRIGFVYGRGRDERRAADSFADALAVRAAELPAAASIVVALDGENPWLNYPRGGGDFLRQLFGRLGDVPRVRPAGLREVATATPPERLERLHPGSWIGASFATWYGHPEKLRAWEELAAVRDAVAAAGEPQPPSLLLAEGSDWFWWLGDDNPTPLAPLYDAIFRRHLADACRQAGIEPLPTLASPLKRSPAAG